MRDFEAEYGVDDGYVGGEKHRFDIPSDVVCPGMTDKELQDLFWAEIQQDFETSVHPYSAQEQEFIAWARETIAEMETEEA